MKYEEWIKYEENRKHRAATLTPINNPVRTNQPSQTKLPAGEKIDPPHLDDN